MRSSTDPAMPHPSTKTEVLQVRLSQHHSLDIVRLPDERKYRIMFAERFGVERRQFVDITFDEALRVSLFMASVDDRIRTLDLSDDRTLGGKPSNVQPREIQEMLDDESLRTAPFERPELPTASRTLSDDHHVIDDPDHSPIPRLLPEDRETVAATPRIQKPER